MKLVIELEVDALSRDHAGRPVIDGAQVTPLLELAARACDGRVLDVPSDGAGTADAGNLYSPARGWWELRNDPLTDPWAR